MAATAWVGGIFFAYMALRPAANATLEPQQRLQLWQSVYSHFFPWVWVMIGLLLLTGYIDLFTRFGGMRNNAIYLIMMHVIGLLMAIFFCYLYFGLYRRLTQALLIGDYTMAGTVMTRARPVMLTNLSLGMLITAIGIAGPSF